MGLDKGWLERGERAPAATALTLGGRGVVHYPARVETVHRGLPALKPSMSAAAGPVLLAGPDEAPRAPLLAQKPKA
jgi:hypothetical protein